MTSVGTADAGKAGIVGLLSHRSVQAAVLLLVALALKVTTFGDLNRHADETFYFLVGQRMHEGILPYVDVWDRKPFGLFFAYYLIAGISHSVLSYQIVACLLAAAAALAICLLVTRWAGWKGGLLAGLGYLFIIGPFEGGTGQTPDFYNPLIASSALLIASELEKLLEGQVGWRIWVAMALCGLALTIKQTVLFESVFFGLCVVFCLYRAGVPFARIAGVAAVCCAIGAAPTLLIAAFYWQAGHWHEFWHAMVVSNLNKARAGGEAWRSLGIVLKAGVLIAFAALGLLRPELDRLARIFLSGWIVAALAGFVAVPNFFYHYALPLFVPLCVAAGLLFEWGRPRIPLFAIFAFYTVVWFNPLWAEHTRGSIGSMQKIAALIRKHDPNGGLLVFEAPPYLYALTGKPFLSPLVFPHHLNHQIENNVSHLDTHAEIDRILATRPGAVVMERFPRNQPVNVGSRKRVLAYVRQNCRSRDVVALREGQYSFPVVIFGECTVDRGNHGPDQPSPQAKRERAD